MPQRTLHIDQDIDVVWHRLQQLPTWDGIGGMQSLRDPSHNEDGTLAQFRFSLETPVGTINDDAEVIASGHSMFVRTEAKGVVVTILLALADEGPSTMANFSIDAEATNFLARPLAATLHHTLESGIDREGARMVERLET